MSKIKLAFFYFGKFPNDSTALNARMNAILPELQQTISINLFSVTPSTQPIFSSNWYSHKNIVPLSNFKSANRFKIIGRINSLVKSTLWFLRNYKDLETCYFYHPYLHTTSHLQVLSYLLKKKVIVEITEIESSKNHQKKQVLHNLKAKIEEYLIAKCSHHILVISREIKQFYAKKVSEKKISILPIVYEPRYENIESSSSRKLHTLLYVGTFANKDGVPFLIKAFAESQKLIKDLNLRLVGHGDTFDDCRSLVQKLNIENHVTFLGSLDSSKVYDEFPKADTLLMNRDNQDYSNYGFPTKLANYLVSGIPILCSNTTSLTKLPEDTVMFYKPNNIDDLVEKITLRYRTDWQSETSRKFAQNHYNPRQAAKTLDSILVSL